VEDKRAHHDAREDSVHRRRNELGAVSFLLALLVELAAENSSKSLGEVADAACGADKPSVNTTCERARRRTDVDRDVVFLGSRSESEGVPLPVGDLGAVAIDSRELVRAQYLSLLVTARLGVDSQKDVLASPRRGLLFLDVHLDDVARVENDFADVGAMARANFAQDPLGDVKQAASEPVLPKDADLLVAAVGRTIGSV
jgi:hypothetical protein